MEKIGKYRIEEKIGVGGFGEVFRGYDPLIKRHVAIKTCSAEEQEIRDRFFQEAEIAGNLHHKNITTIYDFGIHDGLPFLIQEYLSGEDLDAKIKRREYLPYPEKLHYLLQIARGLDYAHSKQIIHRDIKPANIRILEDGTAKIMDFGIAKRAQQESGLTKTGMTIGTAAYLAPEQVRGESADRRTDVFSYGVVAYELLTYERPFQGEQISAVLYQLLNHQPEPITVAWPAAPPGVVTLIDRCLHKDPAQRYADGGDLLRGLEALRRSGRDTRAVAPEKSSDPPTPALAERPARATRPERRPSSRPDSDSGGRATAPRPAVGRLDDISYGSPAGVTAPAAYTQSVAASARARSPFSTAAGLGILLLLALAAAAAGWWFGMRESPAKITPPPSELPSTAAAGEEQPEILGPPDDVTATGEAAVPPASVAQPESPPPPPPPALGKLILPAVDWTDAMTVRIASKTHGLRRQQTIELPPGSYEASFELETADYSPAARSLRVQIVAGRSQRLPIAIPRPAALSIRPFPGRPQGQVSIDGELVGSTPISKIKREPGDYTIEIEPRGGADERLTQTITLQSGQEVILSFNLAAGEMTSHSKPLSL